MNTPPETGPETEFDEERAQKQFLLMQMLRLVSLALLLAGIAITQDAIAAPYSAGIVMVVIGMAGFFFGPPLLARKFVAKDSAAPDGPDGPDTPDASEDT